MMVTRPHRGTIAAGVSRALALHDVTYHDIWEALTALEPPIASAAARNRTAKDLKHLDTLIATDPTVEQAAAFFRAVGEATHNGVFMLAHEPLVELLVPSLKAMINKVPQAAARIATAQKRIVGAVRERDGDQAGEWMAKHIRDFRRGFELANIGLQQAVGSA
jgi:DNA-binding FadR family transcriptional regulator